MIRLCILSGSNKNLYVFFVYLMSFLLYSGVRWTPPSTPPMLSSRILDVRSPSPSLGMRMFITLVTIVNTQAY